MSIILPLAVSVKAYLRRYGRDGPALALRCAGCGRQMREHGAHHRSVVTRRRIYRIPIYRWFCPRCKHTCSVLPDFLCPYARFVTLLREVVVRRRLQRGRSWRDLAREISSPAVSVVSERTLRRWVRTVRGIAGTWGQFLTAWLLEQRPAVDVFTLVPRHEGPDAALHFLLALGDWLRRQMSVDPARHRGLFAFLNGFCEAPAPL